MVEFHVSKNVVFAVCLVAVGLVIGVVAFFILPKPCPSIIFASGQLSYVESLETMNLSLAVEEAVHMEGWVIKNFTLYRNESILWSVIVASWEGGWLSSHHNVTVGFDYPGELLWAGEIIDVKLVLWRPPNDEFITQNVPCEVQLFTKVEEQGELPGWGFWKHYTSNCPPEGDHHIFKWNQESETWERLIENERDEGD